MPWCRRSTRSRPSSRTGSAAFAAATSTPGPPTRPALRSRSAWLPSRAGGAGWPSPPGSRPRTPCSGPCSHPVTTSSSRTTPMAARTGCSPRARALGRRRTRPPGCPTSTRSAPPSSPGARRSCGWRRPTNPLLGIADIEALAARGARRRRAARGRQHVRVAVPPAADRARRRRGRALDDEVPRRALRRGRWGARRRRRGAGGAARVPPERDGRGRRAVRLVAGAARCEDAGRAHGPALRQRRAGRRAAASRTRKVDAGLLARAARPPGPRRRGQADARLRRDGVVPRRRRGAGGPRRLRPRRGLHPRASRSAASSRSSSTRAG